MSARGGKAGRRRLGRVIAGVLLGAGAALGLVRTSGYELPPEVRQKLVFLAPWQYLVVAQLARRIAAPDRAGVVSTDAVDVAGFVDGYVARMVPGLRSDIGGLLGFVEHLAPVSAGFSSRFTRLGPEDQDRVLSWLEGADGLLAGAFDGLRALIFMGYYSDPRTWSILGYEGPTLPEKR